jgi:hypothetical protein
MSKNNNQKNDNKIWYVNIMKDDEIVKNKSISKPPKIK